MLLSILYCFLSVLYSVLIKYHVLFLAYLWLSFPILRLSWNQLSLDWSPRWTFYLHQRTMDNIVLGHLIWLQNMFGNSNVGWLLWGDQLWGFEREPNCLLVFFLRSHLVYSLSLQLQQLLFRIVLLDGRVFLNSDEIVVRWGAYGDVILRIKVLMAWRCVRKSLRDIPAGLLLLALIVFVLLGALHIVIVGMSIIWGV